MKFSPFSIGMLLLLTAVGFGSCERDDDEPKVNFRSSSRLYVSYENFGTTAMRADTNVRIIYPADDSLTFATGTPLGYVSNAKGGSVLYYNRGLQTLFQAAINDGGRNDTTVYNLAVGSSGLLTNNNGMANRLFTRVRGLAYNPSSDNMYISTIDPSNSSIFVVNRPRQKNGYAKPIKKLYATGYQFWGALFAGNNLYTTKVGASGGLYAFDNIEDLQVSLADSSAIVEPSRTLLIPGAENLRGISYDAGRDLLALTDYPNVESAGSGRILLFEGFSTMQDDATLVPTRIITGAATLLEQPVDVVLDSRPSAKYMYVVDQKSRHVLRFLLSASGNAAPDQYMTNSARPVALALDIGE